MAQRTFITGNGALPGTPPVRTGRCMRTSDTDKPTRIRSAQSGPGAADDPARLEDCPRPRYGPRAASSPPPAVEYRSAQSRATSDGFLAMLRDTRLGRTARRPHPKRGPVNSSSRYFETDLFRYFGRTRVGLREKYGKGSSSGTCGSCGGRSTPPRVCSGRCGGCASPTPPPGRTSIFRGPARSAPVSTSVTSAG